MIKEEKRWVEERERKYNDMSNPEVRERVRQEKELAIKHSGIGINDHKYWEHIKKV